MDDLDFAIKLAEQYDVRLTRTALALLPEDYVGGLLVWFDRLALNPQEAGPPPELTDCEGYSALPDGWSNARVVRKMLSLGVMLPEEVWGIDAQRPTLEAARVELLACAKEEGLHAVPRTFYSEVVGVRGRYLLLLVCEVQRVY